MNADSQKKFFFPPFVSIETGTVYDIDKIKSIVLDYLKSHDLSDKGNQKFVENLKVIIYLFIFSFDPPY